MSRIHEALKKAEFERSNEPSAGATGSPADARPALGAEQRHSGAGTATEVLPPSPSVAMAPRGPWRFDDLIAHCAHPQWHSDPNMNVFDPNINSHGAEQLRTLRSRLYQLRNIHPLRTILVTSSVAEEGKTFVTSNLGRALVRQSDRRALIIDGDLRCSRLHVPFGAPHTPGLSDYLSGAADELAIIQHGQEGNLCFIPGGNTATNPSELLSNGRLKVLLDRVAPAFDWVIFDSPPSLPVADANVLADFCDGTLMVVKAASTPSAVVQRACQEFQGRNLIGVVLNAVEQNALSYGSYYGSTPYGHDAKDDR